MRATSVCNASIQVHLPNYTQVIFVYYYLFRNIPRLILQLYYSCACILNKDKYN
jgi:hypothetical protein